MPYIPQPTRKLLSGCRAGALSGGRWYGLFFGGPVHGKPLDS